MHGEKVRCEAQLIDQSQFMRDLGSDFVRNTFGIARLGAFIGQTHQFLLRGTSHRYRNNGVVIAQFIETEGALADDL